MVLEHAIESLERNQTITSPIVQSDEALCGTKSKSAQVSGIAYPGAHPSAQNFISQSTCADQDLNKIKRTWFSAHAKAQPGAKTSDKIFNTLLHLKRLLIISKAVERIETVLPTLGALPQSTLYSKPKPRAHPCDQGKHMDYIFGPNEMISGQVKLILQLKRTSKPSSSPSKKK